MAGKLQFDVTARDGASSEFAAIAAQLRELSRQLRDLDGKRVRIRVELDSAKASAQARQIRGDVDALDGRRARVSVALDTASSAPIMGLARDLDRLDGRRARADVQVTGAEAAQSKVAGLVVSLKALPNRVGVAVSVDVDKSVGDRLAGISAGLSRLGSVAGAAASGATRFRSAASMLMDPSQLPVVERVSEAIATRFRSAVESARVGVDKLSTGLLVMRTSLLGIAALSGTVGVIGGLGISLAELAGSALLVPAAVGGAAVAVGTLKIAFAGFGKAVAAANPAAFAKATSSMAPAATASAVAVRELKAALSGVGSVGKVVQTNMFAGVAEQVQQLGRTYLPVLQSGLGQTATLFNRMGTSALSAVTSLQAVGQVRTIITNTNTALAGMRDTVANAATGFLTLAAAGSSWLPRFGAAIDAGAAKFDTWTKKIVADGSFDRWVGNSVAAFKQLGTILGNVGSITGTVFAALNANGVGLLGTLAGLTGQLRTFLASAQGSSALAALAKTLAVVGDAASRVFGAALKQLGPILTALAPAAQALATALGANLVSVINAAGPVIARFAQALSANPALLVGLAKAAAAVTIGFGPMVAIIGVAATLLKGFVIARVVALALGALGIQGTIVARVLQALTSPLALLREVFPLIARGAGSLAASLLLAAGPIGGLIIAFSTLYATSSQFRAAVGDVSATVGRILTKAFQDAGTAIASTVKMISDIAGTVQQAAGGFTSLASSVLSASGPIGELVSGGLSGLSDLLGQLPGTALAAFAAFKVFGLIAPLFTTASAAVSGFAARMLAFQGATGAGTVAANAAGVAAGRFATVLTKVGAALPLVGVAVIALGAIYGQFSSIADDVAKSVVQGTMSMSGAIEAEYQRIDKNVLFGVSSQKMMEDATNNVRGAVESQLQAMGPLDQANARVQISTKNLADEILRYGENSPQAAEASRVLARDEADLKSKQDLLTGALKNTTEALKAQADQMQSQIDTALAYGEAVKQTAEAQVAANESLKTNGADSKEYAASVDALVRAMNQQINAARDQAGALGGTAAATAAYNTEILRAADLTTQAGRDAFGKLVAGLDATGLAAISSTAKLSGLRTEVVTLPDGRKVTVVVEADRAKLDSVRQGVEDLASKKYVGTVTILGETTGFRGAVTQSLRFADGTTATMKIAADGSPAVLTVGQTKYTIDSTTGTLKVLGDVAPGETSLAGLKLLVDSTTGQVSISATDAPALGVLSAWQALANGTIGIPQLDSNPGLANSVLQLWKSTSDATTGMPTIDANSGKAQGVLNAWTALANGTTGIPALDSNPALAQAVLAAWKARSDTTTGIPTLNANTGPATAQTQAWQAAANNMGATARLNVNTGAAQAGIDSFIRMNNGRTITIYTTTLGSGGTASAGRLAGGGVIGYAGGGVVSPVRAARGLVVPGYSPGRDTVPAVLSRGEAVLVPELVRALGARRILAANAEASGGRAATVTGSVAGLMDGTVRGGPASARVSAALGPARGSPAGASAAAAQTMTAAGMTAVAAGVAQLRGDIQTLAAEIRKQRPFVVEDRSGNPVETARAAALALRIS